jgi:chromate transporter
MKDDIYLTLFLQFALFSIMSVGGANSTLPEMHRQAVEVHRWISDQQFGELFAIAQASPGPNVVFVTILGHFIAGIPGGLITTIAMCGPTCAMAYFVATVFDRFQDAQWRIIIQAGLVPVTIGLIAASAYIIARGANHDAVTFMITAATFALAYWTRITPLMALGLAALIGFTGLV